MNFEVDMLIRSQELLKLRSFFATLTYDQLFPYNAAG